MGMLNDFARLFDHNPFEGLDSSEALNLFEDLDQFLLLQHRCL